MRFVSSIGDLPNVKKEQTIRIVSKHFRIIANKIVLPSRTSIGKFRRKSPIGVIFSFSSSAPTCNSNSSAFLTLVAGGGSGI